MPQLSAADEVNNLQRVTIGKKSGVIGTPGKDAAVILNGHPPRIDGKPFKKLLQGDGSHLFLFSVNGDLHESPKRKKAANAAFHGDKCDSLPSAGINRIRFKGSGLLPISVPRGTPPAYDLPLEDAAQIRTSNPGWLNVTIHPFAVNAFLGKTPPLTLPRT
jgi:hypothetical protein